MFGQQIGDDERTQAWLALLRQAEPETRRGELAARNLLDDGNVCAALQKGLLDFIASEPPTATPDAAAEQYDRFLQRLHQAVPPCRHPDNSANQLPNAPFLRLARAVDGDAFVKYNYLPTNKRKVPRAHRARPAVKTKIRLREIAKRGVRLGALRGMIGKSVAFASSDDLAERHRSGTMPVEEMRDRLGLDDPARFGRDRFMVIYVYGADRVADGMFFRPTVLDAGWKGSAIAFLPSPGGPARPGRTQDLATGQRAEPEVLHAVFPAAEVEACLVGRRLTRDPSATYKSVRLATGVST